MIIDCELAINLTFKWYNKTNKSRNMGHEAGKPGSKVKGSIPNK